LTERRRINMCVSSSSFFPVTGRFKSPAVSLVSLLTAFLRGRKEATILQARKVPFDLYAAAISSVYQIEITKRFTALESLNDDEDVNWTWENVKENIQSSATESMGLHELKQNKPWFDEECLGFLDQRKRAKMQRIQDPSQSKVDILNRVRREVSRHFRNKKKAYLGAKIEKLETNSKIQNIRDLYRGISDFKQGYQPRRNIVKDKKGDLVADSHSIVARWRYYFSQLFNVHGVKDVG